MILPAWPKMILFRHAQEIIKMPAKRVSNNSVSRRVFGHRQKTAIRVGLYARVSTHDQQTLSLQRRAMHDYVERRGWTIAIEVKEVGSGASVRELRQKLIEAARRRDIDVVIVWRLDIVLLRKAARILASVPRPPACFFHAETLL
jgi:predicted site-specific integrase-resolvase